MLCSNFLIIRRLARNREVRLLVRNFNHRYFYTVAVSSHKICLYYPQNLFKRFLSTPSHKNNNFGELIDNNLPNSKKQTLDLLRESVNYSQEKPRSPEDIWASPSHHIKIETADLRESNNQKSEDESNCSVIMFPGQGSQLVGMGKKLLGYSNVAKMYETASEILQYDLLKLCLEGPRDKLDQTCYCQPALLVTSLAAVEKLREKNPEAVENCIATMGFSVGEFAALVFAGAITFESAVRLVHIRGEAMQAASDLVPSGMITVFLAPGNTLPLALEASIEWASKKGVKDPVCSIANYLYPSCKVLAGNTEALEFIEVNHKAYGIKDTRRITVSGAFHTALMEPAMEAWKLALSQVTFSKPFLEVYSNVTGTPYTLNTMKKTLAKHLVRPVKWEQCLHNVYERPKGERFPRSYVCGPGQALKAILKRVNLKSWNHTYHIET